MNAIPWYKSPVYIGIVTSIVSQLLSLAGRADAFPAEQVNEAVTAVFQVVALVALAVAEIKRRTSTVQPIAATKASAELKNAATGGLSPTEEEKKTL